MSEKDNVLGPGGLPKPTAEYEQAEMDRWLARVNGSHDQLCPTSQNYRDRPCFHCDLIAKVRADERGVSEALADLRAKARLRAKVEALPSRGLEIPHATGTEHTLVWRDDVLALLDGGE